MTNNKIAKFETLAHAAANTAIQAKGAKEENKGFMNGLSFLVLSILAGDDNAAYRHVAKSFEKDGGAYHGLRMVLTRARTVLKALNQDGKVTIETKKEKSTFTMEQVKAWNIESEPVFNVSSAYRTIKANEEKPLISPQTEKENVIEYAAQSLGVSEKDIKADIDCRRLDYESLKAQYVLYQGEQEQKAKLENLPVMAENIRQAFLELQALDATLAADILASLNQNENRKAA